MNYRLHRAAVGEHYDNVAFYEERVPGLGADYLADFDAVMAHIEAWPNFYPTFGDPHIRRAGLKRFPFHVIYRAEATQIIVLAISHHRRRPAYWLGRLPK